MAEDAANDAVSKAASEATDSVKDAAADTVRQQICDLTASGQALADGTVSDAGKKAAAEFTEVADRINMPSDIVNPLRTIAEGSEADARKAINDLKAACG
ncbi:MAG: hypothetical protein ACRCTR_07390 [Actinomycetota bacterium]